MRVLRVCCAIRVHTPHTDADRIHREIEQCMHSARFNRFVRGELAGRVEPYVVLDLDMEHAYATQISVSTACVARARRGRW